MNKTVLKLISFSGLALMFASAILFFNEAASRKEYVILACVGTAMWFATVPFWMKRRLHHSE
jgi:EamA domain-containing membrane protein RarD